VSVTVEDVDPLELRIIILENSLNACREVEGRRYRDLKRAVEAWEKAGTSVSKMEKLVEEERNKWLRRCV
jgi:hypothetical protein